MTASRWLSERFGAQRLTTANDKGHPREQVSARASLTSTLIPPAFYFFFLKHKREKICSHIDVESRKNGINKHNLQRGIETQAWRMNMWAQWGKRKKRQIEKVASTYIHYHVGNG